MGDNILQTVEVYLQPLWCNWPATQSISVKKRRIATITPFEVIQSHRGRYQSKSRMRLPTSDYGNSNWHPISYRFGVTTAYCSNFGHCVFEPPLGGGLGTTYDVHLGHILKRVVEFLLVLIEFLLGVTAEALRAIIVSESAILLQRGPFYPKFQVEGVAPTKHSSQKTIG